MASIQGYVRVRSIEEALLVLQREGERGRILAGGTDLLPQVLRVPRPEVAMIDISAVAALRGIAYQDGWARIGAATRLEEIVCAPGLTDGWQALAHAAAHVGSLQIRCLATLGGNLCNASPSADTAPALLALDAEVTIAFAAGERRLPLAQFFAGPRRTVLEPGELLTAILLPPGRHASRSVYIKHAPRRAMDLAVVGVAASFAADGGADRFRIALGAVAPTPMRALAAESLVSAASTVDDHTIERAAACAGGEIAPIDDRRGSARYRRDMAEVLVARALGSIVFDAR